MNLSAHGLLAFRLWADRVPATLQARLACAERSILHFPEQTRDRDGAWTPLWFGDQDAPTRTSRVYGTAVVLEALAPLATGPATHLIGPAADWLAKAQNHDGGFGGEPGSPSNIETTGKALTTLALLGNNVDPAVVRAAAFYLAKRLHESAGRPQGAPSGCPS
jgi:prenyltransferase beta subunit